MSLLCGCYEIKPTFKENNSNIETIETLKSWSFQHNDGTSDYSLFFGLCNKSGEFISVDVDVDIRIVNDENELVYQGKKSVSEENFSYYTNKISGEQFLADVRISELEINQGKSLNGTVYITVSKENSVFFNEVKCEAFNCLPIKDVQLIADSLPYEINIKNFSGKIESKIQIENVTYVFDKKISPMLTVTVYGVKTYSDKSEFSSAFETFRYKLYDSEGYVVNEGMVMPSSLENGDKFKEDILIYNIIPGESYEIKFSEY